MRTTRLLLAPAAGAIAAAATVSPAAAHVGHPLDGLGSGALHPVLGVDHLLAMVAVGVLAAVGAAFRPVWHAPSAFLLAMAAGALAGIAGVAAPGVEAAIAGSLVVVGACVAVPASSGSRLALPAVAVVGALHGNAHGLEVPAAAEPGLYLFGFLAATAALHAAGALAGLLLRRRATTLLAGAGATVSAVGLLLLAGA